MNHNNPSFDDTRGVADPLRSATPHNSPGQVGDQTESAKQKLSHMQDDIASQASEATAAAKRKAVEATEQAKASGRKYAAEKKTKVAEEIGVFSGAIRKASGKLREENHDSIASYVDAAAEQLDHLRDSLEHKSVSQIVDDLQGLTRRRPELVYGGLFIAGLAAMRFLKASKPAVGDPSARRTRGGEGYGTDHRREAYRGQQTRAEQFRSPAAGSGLTSQSSYEHSARPTATEPGTPPAGSIQKASTTPGSIPSSAGTLASDTPSSKPTADASHPGSGSLDPKASSKHKGASR